MSNGRHVRWTKFAALGLPLLYLAGCAGGAPTETAPGALAAASAPGASPSARDVDLMEVADRMRANGDAANAAALYEQAHLANPNWAAPLVSLGDALMEVGSNEDAAHAYAQALALEPKNQDALRGLGTARVLLAQPRFAVAQFKAALTIDDHDLQAYNGLGVALDMTGDHRAAQQQYRAGLAIDPHNAKLLNNLGLSLALSGDAGSAVAILEKVNAAPAATAVTRQNLALAYGLSGQLDAAERVARIDLDEPAVRRNLAFYAAHRSTRSDDSLAATVGVERNGVHYVASLPAAATAPPPSPPADPATPPSPAPVASAGPEPLAPQPPARDPSGSVAVGKPVPLVDPALMEPVSAPAAEPPVPQAKAEPKARPENVGQVSLRPVAAEPSHPVARPAATPTAAPARAKETAAERAPAVAPRPVAPAIASAEAPAYRVQLAAYRSRGEAEAGWGRLAVAEPGLLGGLAPVIQRVDLGPEKGVYFRLQTGGFTDRTGAGALCRGLKERQRDCLVVRADDAGPTGGFRTAGPQEHEVPGVRTASVEDPTIESAHGPAPAGRPH